jgi:hypothetical protein
MSARPRWVRAYRCCGLLVLVGEALLAWPPALLQGAGRGAGGDPTMFPGGHIGFVEAHDAFATRLREVLRER